jgi:hypothetical protein
MIKSELGKYDPIDREKPFPKLMKSIKGKECLVLFSEGEKGTLVSCEVQEADFYIGMYDETWDMENFIDYDGYVILSEMHLIK